MRSVTGSAKEGEERPILSAPILAILNGYTLLASYGTWKSSTIPKPDIAGTFCLKCNKLFQGLNNTFRVGDVRDISALEEAAKKGCHSCSMFQSHLGLLTEDWLRAFDRKLRIWLTAAPNFRIPFPLQGDSATPLKFVVYQEKKVSHLIRHGNADTSTASESSFSLAREWLLQCWTTHASCRPAQEYMPYRPTRLLDVSGTSRTIRLRERDEIPNDAVYVTLSHCWGTHVPHQLTSKNIESLKKEIALDSLGKTFQDAVEVARRLAAPYIWIDCLCIIQDSEEDWARESVVMQHVYGNSFCNIAASSSSDSRGGCFRERNPNAIQPVRVRVGENSGGSSSGQFLYVTDVNLWWERFEKSPLNQRAWVFQERLLSSRVLHFDQDQLVWECNELTACERFPWGTGELIQGPKRRQPLEAIFRKALASDVKVSEIHAIWRPIVGTYSSTKLTHDSDRLVAIHGVAMRIKDVFGGQYAAGLFSRNMNSQLLWHVTDHNTSYRPTQRVAPSWSWTSIAGAINLLPQWDPVDVDDLATNDQIKANRLRETHYCEILNKDTLGLTGSSPNVNRDVLELQCFLIPCFYVASSETQGWKECKHKLKSRRTIMADEAHIGRGHHTEVVTPDPGEDWPLAWSGRIWFLGEGTTIESNIYTGSIYDSILISSIQGDEDSSFYVKLRYDIVSDFRTARKRWLVPVYSVTAWRSPHPFAVDPIRTVNGLILEQCGGEGEARFRRLGVFEIEHFPEGHVYDVMDEAGGDVERFWKGCCAFEGPEAWQRVSVELTRRVRDKGGERFEQLQAKQYRIFLE